jgi:hypothetical protein
MGEGLQKRGYSFKYVIRRAGALNHSKKEWREEND